MLELLGEVSGELDAMISAVSTGERDVLGALLTRGVAGTLAIPGKHGGPVRATASVFVSLPDHPGELARLFADAGAVGVNIEDVRIDHDPGRDTGLVELVVAEDSAVHLASSLEDAGLGRPRLRVASPVGSSRDVGEPALPGVNSSMGSVGSPASLDEPAAAACRIRPPQESRPVG